MLTREKIVATAKAVALMKSADAKQFETDIRLTEHGPEILQTPLIDLLSKLTLEDVLAIGAWVGQLD